MDTFLQTHWPLIMNWIDVLWIPAALLIVHKSQKIKAVLFVLVCMFSLRLQTELIQSTGFDTGFTNLFDGDVFHRGMIFYGICIAIYLILSYYSPYTRGVIYMAASLSIYFMAFFGSMFIMIL